VPGAQPGAPLVVPDVPHVCILPEATDRPEDVTSSGPG
jgi:hypothetical protein